MTPIIFCSGDEEFQQSRIGAMIGAKFRAEPLSSTFSGPGSLNPISLRRGPSKQVGVCLNSSGMFLASDLQMRKLKKKMYNRSKPNIEEFQHLGMFFTSHSGRTHIQKTHQKQQLNIRIVILLRFKNVRARTKFSKERSSGRSKNKQKRHLWKHVEQTYCLRALLPYVAQVP